MAKNALPGLLWPSSAERKKFLELSCRVGSVRNMVRSKICANQGNRTRHSDHPQENTNFLHFCPEFLRNKFENFFQNSYRTIVFSCRVGFVRNMVRSKIYANQGNRTTPSDHPQENPYFLHFSPEFPRNKFENFFKNSYRTIVLTNSSKEVPKFFTRCRKYKI